MFNHLSTFWAVTNIALFNRADNFWKLLTARDRGICLGTIIHCTDTKTHRLETRTWDPKKQEYLASGRR